MKNEAQSPNKQASAGLLIPGPVFGRRVSRPVLLLRHKNAPFPDDLSRWLIQHHVGCIHNGRHHGRTP